MTPEEREKYCVWVNSLTVKQSAEIGRMAAWMKRAELAAEVEAENARLREALATYGKHAVVCNVLNAFNYFGDPKNAKYIPVSERVCNCGFDAALAPKGATE